MNKTAIIYSFNSKKTGKIAEMIKEAFNDDQVELVNAEELSEKQVAAFDQIIMGVPTWFDGELPNYWDEFIPALEDLDLQGKKIALYGLGDQKGYPENFLDGMGIMAEVLEEQGATLIGFTNTDGYEFESSRAKRGDKFSGLAIDYENQSSMNNERVASWVEELRGKFS